MELNCFAIYFLYRCLSTRRTATDTDHVGLLQCPASSIVPWRAPFRVDSLYFHLRPLLSSSTNSAGSRGHDLIVSLASRERSQSRSRCGRGRRPLVIFDQLVHRGTRRVAVHNLHEYSFLTRKGMADRTSSRRETLLFTSPLLPTAAAAMANYLK